MKSSINVVCNSSSQGERKNDRKKEVTSMNRFVNRLEGNSTWTLQFLIVVSNMKIL